MICSCWLALLQAVACFNTFVLPERIQALELRYTGEISVYGITKQWLVDKDCTSARVTSVSASKPVVIRNRVVPYLSSVFKLSFDDLRLQHILSTPNGTHLLRTFDYPNFVCMTKTSLVIAGLCTERLLIKNLSDASPPLYITTSPALYVGSVFNDTLFGMSEDGYLVAIDLPSGQEVTRLRRPGGIITSLKAFGGSTCTYLMAGNQAGELHLYRWSHTRGFDLCGHGVCSFAPECVEMGRHHMIMSHGHTLLVHATPAWLGSHMLD